MLTGKVAIFLRLKTGAFFFFVILFCIKVVGFYKKISPKYTQKKQKSKKSDFLISDFQ